MSSDENIIGYRETRSFAADMRREKKIDTTGKVKTRKRERELTNSIQKTLKKLVKSYYNDSTPNSSQKTFDELYTMKKITTMNMYILSRVIMLYDEKIELVDGDEEFESKVNEIMDHFHKSDVKKKELREDENGTQLKRIRLKQTMISYHIALSKHYHELNISGSTTTGGVKTAFVD